MTNWFDNSFRKVHIIYVSPEWVKDRGEKFDALKLSRNLKDAGVDCIELYCKDHYGCCYYNSSLGSKYPRDILGELLEQTKKLKIKMIAYFSIGWDMYATGNHPHWTSIDKNGKIRRTYPFEWTCLNSGYGDYALKQLQQLVHNYDIDGLWLDCIPIGYEVPESIYMVQSLDVPCYCPACTKSFREKLGRNIPRAPSIEDKVEFFKFRNEVHRVFLERCQRLLRDKNPDAILTYNAAGSLGDPIDISDIISIEGSAPNYARQSFISRWGKSRSKPFEVLTSNALDFWCDLTVKPPDLMKLESAIVLSHGGTMTFGHIPYTTGESGSAQFSTIKEVFKWIEEIEGHIANQEGVSDAAVLIGVKPLMSPQFRREITDGAESISDIMIGRHIQFDIVSGTFDMSKYSLIAIGDQKTLSDEDAQRLRNYVKSGGNLLVTSQTGLIDENGRKRSDFILSDVLGIKFRGASGNSFSYLRLEDEKVSQGIWADYIMVKTEPLDIDLDGADVLGWSVSPETELSEATTVLWGQPHPDETRVRPLITLNKYEKGRAVYIGLSPQSKGIVNQSMRTIVGNIIESLIPQKILVTDASSGVEVVLNKRGGEYVLHLNNYYSGDPNWFGKMTFKDISVKIDLERIGKVKRVYDPLSGENLKHNIQNGYLEVMIDRLNINSMSVIEIGS
ncbi:MAG: beta-galactosidase trimerization domain-containing protein [Planctomycetes bacterium]|nr:beta-galactosidase trimerization domain-containing protein [Planctomycetota bacterium]